MTTVNNCHIKENWHQPRRRGNGLCPHRDCWATADECQCAYARREEIGSSGTRALSGGSLFCSACTKEQETAAAFNESNRLLRGRFRTNLCAEWDWPCMGNPKHSPGSLSGAQDIEHPSALGFHPLDPRLRFELYHGLLKVPPPPKK